MKLGLILPSYSSDAADWCIPVLREFAESLAGRGVEVHAFPLAYPTAPPSGTWRPREYAVGPVRVHALGARQLGWARDPRVLARAVGLITAEARRERFDVLHAVFADECGVVALVAARRLGVPLIVTLAGGELSGLRHIRYGCDLSWPRALAVRLAVAGATRVTVPSEYMAGLFRRRFGRAVEVVPWGVDTARFCPEDLEDGPPVRRAPPPSVLCVAEQMRLVKNVPLLVRALARVAAPGTRLVLVGGGARPDVPEHITLDWRGHVPWDALPALYRAADLCALTSWHEAFGMAALEALASGVPVVGAAVGVLPEACDAGAGLCAASGDEHALAQALGALLADGARRAACGARARALAAARYAWPVVMVRWLGVFTSCG
jgi:glycosyltransferase involved in cell wall biosynthesis